MLTFNDICEYKCSYVCIPITIKIYNSHSLRYKNTHLYEFSFVLECTLVRDGLGVMMMGG